MANDLINWKRFRRPHLSHGFSGSLFPQRSTMHILPSEAGPDRLSDQHPTDLRTSAADAFRARQRRDEQTSADNGIDDLVYKEFSEFGRSERFGSGWWILPGIILAMITIVLVAAI